jgi:D-3-phosphoglycerate dehydrogenase
MPVRLSVAKEKLKFVLLEGIHPSAVDVLQRDGYTSVLTSKRAAAGDELRELLADAHFLGIRSRTHLTAETEKWGKVIKAAGVTVE